MPLSAPGKPYDFRPLSTGMRQIRLIRLTRDFQLGRIYCSFSRVSLNSNPMPFYKAISYVWGSPGGHKVWFSGNQFLDVGSNLAYILELIVDDPSLEYIWIDALCINQADNREKGHQIRLLQSIFATAEQVLGFVGPPSLDSDLAIGFIHSLKELAESQDFLLRSGLMEPGIDALDFQEMVSWGGSTFQSPRWTALKRFIQRPWFQRSWIVQEVVVGTNPVLICGSEVVDWDDLAFVLAVIGTSPFAESPVKSENCKTEADSFYRIQFTYGFRCGRLLNQVIPLDSYISASSLFTSTLPQDKWYSVLGIAADATDLEFNPDYDSPVEDIYTKLTSYLFLRDQSLELLCMAGIGYRRNLTTLPTWVPDISSTSSPLPFGGRLPYKAGGEAKVEITSHTPTNRLLVKGCLIDSVVKVFPPLPYMTNTGDRVVDRRSRGAFLAWLIIAECFISSSLYRPTGEPRSAAFWSVLLTDGSFRVPYGHKKPEPQEYGDYFFTLKLMLAVSLDDEMPDDTAHAFTNFLLYENQSLLRIISNVGPRTLFWTQQGFLGLGPAMLHDGDEVCIIHGVSIPFLLRRDMGPRTSYSLIGGAYIHGLMAGEGLKEAEAQIFALS